LHAFDYKGVAIVFPFFFDNMYNFAFDPLPQTQKRGNKEKLFL
jgi:hypothetical protein